MSKLIDLRSDTVTQPTPAMRQAMFEAVVGDDVYGDDPTVNRLEETAARILGKEAALFVPSGTMSNQLGILVNTQRGDEVIVGRHAHIYAHEVGAPAVLAGVGLCQVDYPHDIPQAALAEAAIRDSDIHKPLTTLLCVENALSNGRVVPLETMRELYAMAQRRGLKVHMDGARLFNAATALSCDVRELAACCDTLSCCLSKGLCAPVGSVFCADRETVTRARKYRKLLGGGMRQAGFLAAAALIAIEQMPQHLATDHANARHLAALLEELPQVSVARDQLDINMVFFRLDVPPQLEAALPQQMQERGVLINPPEDGWQRWVTNHGVSEQDVEQAVAALAALLN